VHDPKEKKRQINRLSRVIGHLEYVKKMLENDEDCSEVLMQLAASRSALNGLGKEIINEHMAHCITHAIEEGDMESVEEFKEAIKRYL
jgi:DNA-binding FrmR family transcriptional regulator